MSNMILSDTGSLRERVNHQTQMVSVVERYVTLRKYEPELPLGLPWKSPLLFAGDCPFCGAKDRLRVGPPMWGCGACGAKGDDAVDFTARIEGLSTEAALHRLAIQCGLVEPDPPFEEEAPCAPIQFFASCLTLSPRLICTQCNQPLSAEAPGIIGYYGNEKKWDQGEWDEEGRYNAVVLHQGECRETWIEVCGDLTEWHHAHHVMLDLIHDLGVVLSPAK